ncbi:MAG: type II secretion system protein J [Elusimicrobiota bacterium]
MRRRRSSSGFTLVELIVGVLLGSIVLMGAFSMMTNMITAEVNGMRSDTVTSWSLAGINTMNTDIAGASALSYPGNAGSQGDNRLVICTQWSTKSNPPQGTQMLGAIPTAAPTNGPPMYIYNYCWDQDAGDVGTPFYNALLRKRTHLDIPTLPAVLPPGSCPTVPLTCNQLNYTGGDFGSDTIVATGVYPDTNNDFIFTADPNTLNAVRVRFVVGNPNASAKSAGGSGGTVTPVPVSVPFNTEIILED